MLSLSVWTSVILSLPFLGGGPGEPHDGPAAGTHLPHPLTVDGGLEVNRLLRLARHRECDQERVVRGILKQGGGALPAGLAALEERRLPSIDGQESQVLSELQEALLVQAWEHLDRDHAWSLVQGLLSVPEGESPSASRRRAALLAAGAFGLPEDVPWMARLALVEGERTPSPEMQSAFRQAVEQLARRRPEGLAVLEVRWRDYPAPLLPALIQGAGAAGDPRALPLLAQTLEVTGDLESISLAELCRQRAPEDVPADLLLALRSRLDSDVDTRRQSAATALGYLGDFGSAEALTELLRSADPGVALTAHRALCNLSGLSLPQHAGAWHAWSERERRWFVKRAQKLEQEILAGRERPALAAVTEIALYRWERHRLSEILSQALVREEPALRVAACGALGQLGSPRSVPALRALLADQEPAVVAAARAALQTLGAP